MVNNSSGDRKIRPNMLDERFRRNTELINKVIHSAMADRRIDLRPIEVCRQANISRPTFYAHCGGVSDALDRHETAIINQFVKKITKLDSEKSVIFAVILRLISDEREYFEATMLNHDYYLLSKLFITLKSRLVSNNITDKCYEIYMQQLLALIFCWAKYEDFSRQKIPFYTKKLIMTRVMDLGL